MPRFYFLTASVENGLVFGVDGGVVRVCLAVDGAVKSAAEGFTCALLSWMLVVWSTSGLGHEAYVYSCCCGLEVRYCFSGTHRPVTHSLLLRLRLRLAQLLSLCSMAP